MQLRPTMISLTLGLALTAVGVSETLAQDVPNVLVMIEDSDRDTVPRDSRVHRNILSGMNDQMNTRGYRVFDEQALGIDGFQETTASDRVRRTDQELIIVARTVARPQIDVVVAYEAFASVEKLDFASFARLRLTGRALDPQSGRFLGSFEVISPDTFRLPVECPRECLLERLSAEGRPMGVELADVLADKVDSFFLPAAAAAPAGDGQRAVGDAAGATPNAAASAEGGGFERTYTLAFQGCNTDTRADFEPYLVVFEGYLDHRPNACTSTSCEITYTSTIRPSKLQRNLERMLEHSGHAGRVSVSGRDYAVACTPQRQRTPKPLNAVDW